VAATEAAARCEAPVCRQIGHCWLECRRAVAAQQVGKMPECPGSVPPAEPAEHVRAHGA